MIDKPFASHTVRNSEPILEVLRKEFRHASCVLEIGSGTGQHAIAFAAGLGHLVWQTSDLEENHAGIRAWLADAALPNLREPLSLDVRTAELSDDAFDAAFSANTAHILSIGAVAKMFTLIAGVLRAGGVFCLYGPFRQDGEFNASTNADFHQSLCERDPEQGIRNLEDLDQFAATGGMTRKRVYAMPANNIIVVWHKSGDSNYDNA